MTIITVVLATATEVAECFSHYFGNDAKVTVNTANTVITVKSKKYGDVTIRQQGKSWRLYRGSALQGTTTGNPQHLRDIYIDISGTNPLQTAS